MNQPSEITRPLRVAVIEPHQRVRQALTDRLATSPLIEIAASQGVLPSPPELISSWNTEILLIGLPQSSVNKMRRIENAIRSCRQHHILVVILTVFDDALERDVLAAAGVNLILLKQINTPQLIDVLIEAVNNRDHGEPKQLN